MQWAYLGILGVLLHSIAIMYIHGSGTNGIYKSCPLGMHLLHLALRLFCILMFPCNKFNAIAMSCLSCL